jgi:hypothetical protein
MESVQSIDQYSKFRKNETNTVSELIYKYLNTGPVQ